MVFKVKKRGAKSYNKFRRSLVTDDTSALPDEIGSYSYNWPYDYFSLVELVKLDETVQYASQDLLDPSDPAGITPTTTRAATPPVATTRARQTQEPTTTRTPTTPTTTRAAPATQATEPTTTQATTTTRATTRTRGGGSNRGGNY